MRDKGDIVRKDRSTMCGKILLLLEREEARRTDLPGFPGVVVLEATFHYPIRGCSTTGTLTRHDQVGTVAWSLSLKQNQRDKLDTYERCGRQQHDAI